MKNEQAIKINNIHTVLFGLKPLQLPPPVEFVLTRECVQIEDDSDYSLQVPASQTNTLYADGKPYATTTRWHLKKETTTGRTTLRLFKNKTTLLH